MHVIDITAPCLSHIFNGQMQTGKESVRYKKGIKNHIGLSSGLEKVLFVRVVKFLEKRCLLTPTQLGFRENRFSKLALLEQNEFI